MTASNKKKVKHLFVTTGGTGGHLFPASVLIQDLIKQRYQVTEIVDQRAYHYMRNNPLSFPKSKNLSVHVLHIGRGQTLWKKIQFIGGLIASFFKSLKIIATKRPDAVVCFGGYATFPVTLAAVLTRTPLFLHEQNAVIGRVNKWFAPFAKKITTTFPEVKNLKSTQCKKLVFTGNLVRENIRNLRTHTCKSPPVQNGPLTLLVIGGSQGASSFAQRLPQALGHLPAALRKRLFVLHQVPQSLLESTGQLYKNVGIQADLAPFFSDIHRYYEKADLVISRAGASTVSELLACHKPAVYIPYPHAMDDHQTYNAQAVVTMGGGWMLSEKEKDFGQKLFILLEQIFNDPRMLKQAQQALALSTTQPYVSPVLACIEKELYGC